MARKREPVQPDLELNEDEQAIAAAFETETEPVEAVTQDETEPEQADEPEEADELDTETDEPEPEQPAAQDDQYVDVNGYRIDRQRLADYAALDAWAQANPERWQQLLDVQQGRWQPQPAYQPQPQPTEAGDTDVYEDEHVAALRQRLEALQQWAQQRDAAEAGWALQNAITTFRAEHPDVTDADWDRVRQITETRRLIQNVREAQPNMPREQIARRAFEDAYKIEFFDRHREQAGRQVVTDMRRRRKAAASASTSRSMTRTAPEPTTDRERHEAMVSEIAAALNGE